MDNNSNKQMKKVDVIFLSANDSRRCGQPGNLQSLK
jgi:hypothetical protein